MAFVLKDRVKDTTTTTGTGSVTLSGTAPTGFQNFNAAIGTSNTTYYCIAGQGTSEWEVGLGTLSASTTLARTTVYASSNAGSLVNFSAGTKDVFVTFPASVAVQQLQYALYTSGTATWTAPVGVSQIKVICVAGGGGGAANNNRTGGGGGLAVGIYTVTPGTGYAVTVGAGGAGTITVGGTAGSGGSSSLGSLISATGGAGGSSPSGNGTSGSGSNGNLRNALSVFSSNSIIAPFSGGVGINIAAIGITAPITWSISSIYAPGAAGEGSEDYLGNLAATGGAGGIIYIEYVG